MVLYKYTGCVVGVDAFETLDNDIAGLQLIFSFNLGFGHIVGAGDGFVEIVGMCSTDIGDVLTCLCPCGGIGGVGVDNTLDIGECTIEHKVGGGV